MTVDPDFDPKKGEWFYFWNKIADALAKLDLSNAEFRFLFCIIRHAWGYGKSYCFIRTKTILEYTELSKTTAWRAEARLLKRNILQQKKGFNSETKTAKRFKINSKTRTWKRLHAGNRFHAGNKKAKKVAPMKPVPLKTIYKDKEALFINANRLIDEINSMSGKTFTHSDTNLKPVLEVLECGFSMADCRKVIKTKWNDDTFDKKFYQPKTLFKDTNFECYLNEAPTSQNTPKKSNKWFVSFARDVLRTRGKEEALKYCHENRIDRKEIGL